MKKIIYLNAGHDTVRDPGVITEYGRETDYNRAIRDALAPKLEAQGFVVQKVPDYLSLRESIDWVNERAKRIGDGLALDIHCNCCGLEGAEAYYFAGSNESKKIGKKLVDTYSIEMGMKNRGSRSDRLSGAGELGWIRKTNCWATLIECGYLDNRNDVRKIKDYPKTARAICKGVCSIYEIEYIKESPQPKPKKSRAEIVSEIKNLADQLL